MSEKSKKEIIMEKAALLFRKKGFTATSMQDIAESVGMKAASLYNHIGSKQEILSELLLDIANDFTSGMTDIECSTLNTKEKLEALVDLHVEMTIKNKDSISLLTGEWVHLNETALKPYTNLRNNYEVKFLEILNKCKEENIINKNTHLELALYSILSSLHWLYSWYNKHPHISRIELSKQLKHLLLKGIIK